MVPTATAHADVKQVQTLGDPDLYRKNLFRVLGIPVTASVQDARRSQRRQGMARRLGTFAAPLDGVDLLALRDPSEEAIRVSLERLSDPKARLLDEIFWFWPTGADGKADPGLAALERGDVQGALDVWSAGSKDAATEAIKAHNRAVLNHMIALELEVWIAARSDGGADRRGLGGNAQALWEAALDAWGSVLDNNFFWHGVKCRVEELNDPQLTTGSVRRIRETLPGALRGINAQIALRAAERGDDIAAQAHSRLVRRGKSNGADETLRTTLSSIRHRLETSCEQATKAAESDPEHGNEVATELLEDTKPLLHTVDLLLPENDISRSAMHDAVAEAVLTCLIAFGNRTEDWIETKRLLDIVAPVATGQALRSRMEENRQQVERNCADRVCFYCGKGRPDPEKAVEVKMYGDVQRTPNYYTNSVEITWRHGTIKVPRCADCASLHDQRLRIMGWVALITAVVAFLFFTISNVLTTGDKDLTDIVGAAFLSGLIGITVGVALSWLVVSLFSPLRGIKDTNRAVEADFPAIRDLLAKGWTYGEKPNTNQ